MEDQRYKTTFLSQKDRMELYSAIQNKAIAKYVITEITRLEDRIKQLEIGIELVSARLEDSKPPQSLSFDVED